MFGDRAIARPDGLPDIVLAEDMPDLPPPAAPLSDDGASPRAWRHWIAALGAVLVNLLLITLIVYFSGVPRPLPLTVIPVQLVTALPKPPEALHKPAARKPPEKPQPKPKPKPKQVTQKPPPPPPKEKPSPKGPLASEDLGNPDAPRKSHTMSDSPPTGAATPKPGSEQPKLVGKTAEAAAAMTPSPTTLGRTVPAPKPVEKPMPKEGGAKAKASPGPERIGGHHAKYPGPDASEDAYMKYITEMIEQNGYLLTPDQIGNRSGSGKLEITVRSNGAIVWVVVEESSGFPDIDKRAEEMVNRVGQFPPLPRYIEGPIVEFEYTFEFPAIPIRSPP